MPGADSSRKLCSCAMHWMSFLACRSVTTSLNAALPFTVSLPAGRGIRADGVNWP